jgi:hypothetical protein
MIPQEKAQELVDKYRLILINTETDAGEEILCTNIAKQCALIAVDEMMEVYASSLYAMGLEKHVAEITQSEYLQQIKQEIEKL